MLMQPSTIRDVARLAGVSVATVSRVINDSAPVKEETRLKVLQAVETLGFSPNVAARRLSGGKTYTIGVISPLFTRPAFVERLTGVQAIFDASDYDLVLYSIRSVEDLERRLQTLIGQRRVDGLITLSVYVREQHRFRQDFPLISIDDERTTVFPSIVIDNVYGGRLATEYVIRHGHRAIGFVGDEPDSEFDFISSQRRFEGFQQALAEANLPLQQAWCYFGTHSRETAFIQARHFLTQPARPSAIVAASDTQAIGILSAARDLGMNVPADLAVIGFDDIEPATYMNLTTVRAGMFESGKLGGEYLLGWLRNGKFSGAEWRTVLPLEIVERASV